MAEIGDAPGVAVARYDDAPSRDPTMAVISAVATAHSVRPLDLPPLAPDVDFAALRKFSHVVGPETSLELQFEAADCELAVDGTHVYAREK